MPLEGTEIIRRIKSALPDADIDLHDLAGDNDHWAVTVTTPAFAGLSRVAQHKMVYDAIGADMGGALHALKITTKASI